MRKIGLTLVAVVLVLALSEGEAKAQNTRITGKVTAHASGKPVEGAKLVFKHVDTGTVYEAETDEKGNYRIGRAKYGSYDVEVSKEGYTSIKQTYYVEPRSNETTVINVDL